MYAIQQQFEDAFGLPESIQLTNLDDPLAVATNPVPMDSALRRASALIDSYLGARYQLPIVAVPSVLEDCCLDVARYYLDRINPREDVRLRYEDWFKNWLPGVASGKISLGGALPLGAGADQLNTGNQSPGMVAGGSAGGHDIDLDGYFAPLGAIEWQQS